MKYQRSQVGEFVALLRLQLYQRSAYLKQQLVLLGYVREHGDIFNVGHMLQDDLGRGIQIDSIIYELEFIDMHLEELNELNVRKETLINNVMKYEVDKLTQTKGNNEAKYFDKLLEDYDVGVEYSILREMVEEQDKTLIDLGRRLHSEDGTDNDEVKYRLREDMNVLEVQKMDLIECLSRDRYVSQVLEDYESEKGETEDKELKEEKYKYILDILT